MTTDDDHSIPDNHAAQFTRELLDQAIMLAARDRAMAAANTVEVRDLAERIGALTIEVDSVKDDAKSYHAVEKALARVRGEVRPGTPADELIAKIIDQREAYYGFMNEARDNAQAIVRDRDTAMTLMRLRDDSYPTCEESARALIAKFDQVTEHGRRAASDLAKARFDAECRAGRGGVETERLAKLEAKLMELEAKHPDEPERCPVCNWTNGKLMNYGAVGESRWMCHGCAARAIQGAESRPALTVERLAKEISIVRDVTMDIATDTAQAVMDRIGQLPLPAYGPMEVLTSERLAEALDFSGALVRDGEPRVPQIRSIANAVMRYLVPSTLPSTLPSDEMRSALLEAIYIISHFPTTQLADEAVERFKAIASRPVTVAAVSVPADVIDHEQRAALKPGAGYWPNVSMNGVEAVAMGAMLTASGPVAISDATLLAMARAAIKSVDEPGAVPVTRVKLVAPVATTGYEGGCLVERLTDGIVGEIERAAKVAMPIAPVDITAVMRDGVGPDAAPAGTPVAATGPLPCLWCGKSSATGHKSSLQPVGGPWCGRPECKWVTVHIAPVDPAAFARDYCNRAAEGDEGEGAPLWRDMGDDAKAEQIAAARATLESRGIPVTPATHPAVFARPAPVEMP